MIADDLARLHGPRIAELRKAKVGRRRIAEILTEELGFTVGAGLVRSAVRLLDAANPEAKPEPEDPASLLQYATPRQAEAIEGLIKYGSIVAAAEALEMSASGLRRLLSEARGRAARRGHSPGHDMTKTVPDGFHVKGVSTYYGRDKETGELVQKGQWVKSARDEEHKVALLLDALQAVVEPLQGKSEFVEPPAYADDDLLTVYPMGDPHIGMYAWAAESGEDFDLEIGERNLVAAVDHLVALAPSSSRALIVNLGDFFHGDTTENRTARSGHALDVDTRWAKVLEVGIKIMRRCIDQALAKHATVRVVNEIGNHDDHSAVMLSLALKLYYENNPRVEIDTSPDRFHWYHFGENLIGITHGNGIKLEQLPGIMAHDRKVEWGTTTYRHWYTGHVHSDKLREFPGVVVETFRTLAARDAYAQHAGYRSGRDMKCDVFHRQWGRINRHIVGIEQLRRAA